MIEKNTMQKVFAFFCDYPTTIHLRELSRRLQRSMPAILSAVKKLEREDLITVDKQRAWTMVKANIDNPQFIRLKRVQNLERLYESGLVDALIKISNHPQAIVCFGSYSRGEDTERSDIDIAIINGRNGELPKKFDETLKRKVSIHFPKMERVSEEFKAELRNGIILEGAW